MLVTRERASQGKATYDGFMARVTGEGEHGHVYEEDDMGVIVAGWCLGDRPWRSDSNPVPDERAHVVLSREPDCPHAGRHDPIKIQ